MVAYFSSKLSKHVRALIAITLLLICMVGTNWFGFAHSISHGIVQQQTIDQASASDHAPTFSHSSDACHLFDALTLAGFIPNAYQHTSAAQPASLNLTTALDLAFSQAAVFGYHSRAPPTFIL
ncbi:hypothetical protein FD961_04385 [Polynucleobacter sp. TSB-Sco08W16]|uniref:hypothetical protein n=1 Tax=Polynucleobacter sp. TSB-Sco08W16 TaxID=1758374 RepID=UPI001BFE8231|nr:hypothetical protein [Polynucleobacter sp. TSB-Sco08W16]QWD75050.1 hypothetical protein FD961_04385 [Polynucleobacter sp. TSB-Sco08W16]